MSDTLVASLVVGVAFGVTGAFATAVLTLYFRRTRPRRRLWTIVAVWSWLCVITFAILPIGFAMAGELPFWATSLFTAAFYLATWPMIVWALRETRSAPGRE